MGSLSQSRKPRHRRAIALLGGAIAATPSASRAGSNSYFTDLTIGPSGYLTGAAGDNFYVSGNFSNNSTQTNSWNTSGALLGFQGGTSHQLTVAGSMGQFGWGTLQINSGDSVTVNGNSVTAAATVNNGSLSHVSGAGNLGSLSGTGSLSVGNSVGPVASVTVSSFAQSTITVNATGTLTVTDNSSPVVNSTNGLAIAPGGKLDLANNTLMIHYASGLDPLLTIMGYLDSGYDNGKWDGTGIYSSAVASGPANTFGIGIADSADGVVAGLPADTIEVRYTRVGDANLDQVVNLSDALLMVRNWNATGSPGWDQGNFNYDSTVNLSDAALLQKNWNGTVSGSAAPADASVPEPMAGLIGGASLFLRRRRSR